MRALLIIAALLAFSSPTLAAPHRCAGPIANAAAKGGIAPAQIKRTVFVDVTDGGRDGAFVVGYEAWIDMKSCKGTIVAKMTLQCEIEETYSRGACDFPGLKNFR